jgi:hypothetical protein
MRHKPIVKQANSSWLKKKLIKIRTREMRTGTYPRETGKSKKMQQMASDTTAPPCGQILQLEKARTALS